MDPNENVRQQNALIAAMDRADRDGRDPSALAAELRELQQALREWLAAGGFAPTERLITECCCDEHPDQCWVHERDDSGDCYPHSDAAW